jgi:TatD DNase family protein
MFVDSHAHLFHEDYGKDLQDVLQRARDAGVDQIIVPGTDEKTSREALELSEKYEFIYACVGIHPHEALKATDKLLEEIESMANHRKVVAIGEIGLDYHYDFSPREQQLALFKQQIELAIRMNLPIVVHTRESLTDTIGVVDQCLLNQPEWRNGNGKAFNDRSSGRGVFHCFTGSAVEAAHLFAKGFFISYPGIVTFKNSPVTETLKQIGIENILLETDSPYLAPAPLRGKRNEPSYIVHIAKKIAEVLDAPEADIASVTSLNAKNLFGLREFRAS